MTHRRKILELQSNIAKITSEEYTKYRIEKTDVKNMLGNILDRVNNTLNKKLFITHKRDNKCLN